MSCGVQAAGALGRQTWYLHVPNVFKCGSLRLLGPKLLYLYFGSVSTKTQKKCDQLINADYIRHIQLPVIHLEGVWSHRPSEIHSLSMKCDQLINTDYIRHTQLPVIHLEGVWSHRPSEIHSLYMKCDQLINTDYIRHTQLPVIHSEGVWSHGPSEIHSLYMTAQRNAMAISYPEQQSNT